MSHHVFEAKIYIVCSLDTLKKGSFSYMSFDVLSLFLLDLVFSDCQMKKGHEGIMVESEHYHRIVCCFCFE